MDLAIGIRRAIVKNELFYVLRGPSVSFDRYPSPSRMLKSPVPFWEALRA